ncbi:uncharacterized protein LOC106651480 isoform X2 [Trichogramma pretiosum]|uniref:uncharacterized protein LOC106651480 isoform X2 n=1 Tax=Trichogramma pretiosum TaxID=7493 RepID=UPI0006C98E70|nr:uncharacterized protein LOC106651480 isoform X2 [Trichogramma pretiosum]
MELIRRPLGGGSIKSSKLQLLLVLLLTASGSSADIDVSLRIPAAVAENSTVKMTCDYNLNNMPLYSVKWYKGNKEFYRFIPKELPPKSVFPPLGPKVDYNQSDDHHVILRSVETNLAGRYRCEVSTDSPSFITRVETGYMHVVKMPQRNMTLRMEKKTYSPGDTIRGNCTAPPANPAANITWTINDRRVNSSSIRNIGKNDNRTLVQAGLELELRPEILSRGRSLRITCRANIFHLYDDKISVVLEEEHPKLATVLGTRDTTHNRSTTSARSSLLALLLTTILTLAAATR